jgi:hypothetical protein
VPAVVTRYGQELFVIMIGIDPHKESHTAVAVDVDEHVLAELKVRADRRQTERLLAWAALFEARTWAIEGAAGLGYLLAQQLVAAGEIVVDVPAILSARVRLLGSGKAGKNDPTTHAQPRSLGCAMRICALSSVRITPLCCGCWPTATTTSPRCARRRCAGYTRCCARWLLAGLHAACRLFGPLTCCAPSVLQAR